MDDDGGAGRDGVPPLAVLEHITKRFPGVVANDDVSLEIHPGEIHALIGENGAGKSTLMHVLYGEYGADAGRILVRDREVRISSPRAAIAHGIGMVHQHFLLVSPFTVAENVILGQEGGRLLHPEEAERRVGDLADVYGFRVDPSATVESLSVGEEQRVEILKALYRGVDILILDEPTAVLTPEEAKDLFANLRRLKEDGKAIAFISHKLDEVLDIADRITVMRHGAVVGQTRPGDTTKAHLAEMMVGRPVLFRLDKPQVEVGDPVLEVEDVRSGRLRGFSLTVRAGEIVGLAGVEGNGQRELADVIMGLRPIDSGRVVVDGRDLAGLNPEEIRDAGVGFIPEDRHGQGLVLDMSLWENSVLGRHDDPEFSGRGGVLYIRKIKQLAERLLREFDVRARSIEVTARTLSGGNQQKMILARELEPDPDLLIAAQPTRGLDVGAIEFVWRQILDQKGAGRAVLLISAELDEIFALSDRIVTIYEGRVTGEFAHDAPVEDVGRGMLGGPALGGSGLMAAVAPSAKVVAAPRRPEWLELVGGQLLALLAALVIALILGSLIILGYGESPRLVYGSILRFSFGSAEGVGYVLANATPLIFSALAVAVCFKGGMFNIGVEGQYIVGMLVGAWAAVTLDFMPGPLLMFTAIAFSMLGGVMWAAVPAVLKVRTGAHEVVTTIMMNGIAGSLVAWAVNGPLKFKPVEGAGIGFNINSRTETFGVDAKVPDLGHLFGIRPSVHLTWLFPAAVLLALVIWFVMRRTRLGYEARAVGASAGSARAGGISIGGIQLKLFVLSGALAGLVGIQQMLGEKNFLPLGYEAGLGFTGIAVAFLGQNNPIGIVVASIVWGTLARGETALQIDTDVPREFVIILQGIFIMSVVVTYQIARRRLLAIQLRRAAAVEEAAEDQRAVAGEGA